MSIKRLFEMQKILDDKIVKGKGLEGVDLLDKKILALQVELGELANEWRGFKFWSEDQEPRTVIYKNIAMKKVKKNPLLEEYVDCLHFILSIGNEWSLSDMIFEDFKHRADNITKQFNYVFYTVMSIDERIVCSDYDDIEECFGYLFSGFAELGEMLGFTWQQIEQAYYDKNKVNHERQNNGY